MRRQVTRGLDRVRAETQGITAIVGYPEYADGTIYNAAAIVRDGASLANYRKQFLPNYKVFDEKRYLPHRHQTSIVTKNLYANSRTCYLGSINSQS